MDYQVVGREVGGKVRAGNHIDPQCGSDPFAEHRRNFDPADVFAHRSVRAGFGDQHAGVFAELPDGCRALHEVVDVALVTGEEHRERSQQACGGLLRIDSRENLRVGDNQFRRCGQRRERAFDLVGGTADHAALLIEQLADRLDLRQDEASLGGLDVLRHDEHHHVARRGEAARDFGLVVVFGQVADQGFAQGVESRAVRGADPERLLPEECFGLRIGHTGNQVGLAAYHYRRNMPFFQEPEPFYFVVLRHGFGEEKDGQVGFVQHLAALLHAQRAEVAFIVETRRVDQYARSQPVYLHRLEYGIGRRARRRGNDSALLAREGVNQRRLAAVAPPVESDMQPFGAGSLLVHRAKIFRNGSPVYPRRSLRDSSP